MCNLREGYKTPTDVYCGCGVRVTAATSTIVEVYLSVTIFLQMEWVNIRDTMFSCEEQVKLKLSQLGKQARTQGNDHCIKSLSNAYVGQQEVWGKARGDTQWVTGWELGTKKEGQSQRRSLRAEWCGPWAQGYAEVVITYYLRLKARKQDIQ